MSTDVITTIARRTRLVLDALLTAAAMSACGGNDSGATSADGTVSVALAETPGIPQYFAEFGVQKGFFEDEGIDLEVKTLPGGAQQATAALAGDVQFTGGDVVAFTTFRDRDLPMTIVRPGTAAAETPADDFSTVQVPKGSDIQTVEDLAGATVAVNELDNVGTVTIREVLRREGVDPDAVSFVELPFPDMLPSLAAGSGDAAWLIEPFSTIGQAQGNRSIMSPYAQYAPGTQIGLVLATKQYAQQNPKIVDAFQKAHARTAEYITAHPDEFKQALVKLGDFDPKVVAQLKLPQYTPQLDIADLERVATSMVDEGLIKKAPSYDGFVDDDA